MSRIGRKPILIPAGVTVTNNEGLVVIKGVKGEITIPMRPEIELKIESNVATFSIKRETSNSDAYWGLTRALIANAVAGVEKRLELVGVGYRVKVEGDGLVLTLGFSHPVKVSAPKGIKFTVLENNVILVSGPDKNLVGLTAAQIRKLRKPEPYKGKGIKYAGEIVRRKAGKSGKAAK